MQHHVLMNPHQDRSFQASSQIIWCYPVLTRACKYAISSGSSLASKLEALALALKSGIAG
eukprot:scaffold211736_cov17-Tisochrysis_lutea.AAC.1